jgi:hypothetical protein
MSQELDKIHKEADAINIKDALADKAPQPAHASAAAAVGPASFCKTYGTTRPILLSIVSLLKLFHRGDAANAIASTVAFLDLTCGTGGGGGGGTP